MREMHKWKDKVELSLDNRQIFFLFFGLSVVGCFVFALGVMVGRRVEFDPKGEVAALTGDSLELLGGPAQVEQALSFKEGLQTPATEGLPQTRDPDATPAEDAGAEDADPAKSKAEPKTTGGPKVKAEPAKADPAQSSKTTLASGTKSSDAPASSGQSSRQFTLQMKAFARAEDAEAFAVKLRSNGHDVRVEPHEVKGRVWHRVRVGAFDSWSEGLQAKEDFEQAEKIIAYVVRL